MDLKINNLTKKYGDFKALENVTLELEEGIYGFLGLNGAGKTTLINILTDNLKRSEGEILFEGQEILKLGSNFRKLIGYMPQEQGYYSDFTARNYLKYMASLKGMKRKEANKQINQLLELLNLTKSADKKMSEYSGGMRQRSVLAQALLNDPPILILDEPTVGLDPKERANLKDYIVNISKNKIILYCTHVVSDIENIADEIILLKNGKVIKKGSVEELCQEIKNNSNGFEVSGLEEVFLYYMK